MLGKKPKKSAISSKTTISAAYEINFHPEAIVVEATCRGHFM